MKYFLFSIFYLCLFQQEKLHEGLTSCKEELSFDCELVLNHGPSKQPELTRFFKEGKPWSIRNGEHASLSWNEKESKVGTPNWSLKMRKCPFLHFETDQIYVIEDTREMLEPGPRHIYFVVDRQSGEVLKSFKLWTNIEAEFFSDTTWFLKIFNDQNTYCIPFFPQDLSDEQIDHFKTNNNRLKLIQSFGNSNSRGFHILNNGQRFFIGYGHYFNDSTECCYLVYENELGFGQVFFFIKKDNNWSEIDSFQPKPMAGVFNIQDISFNHDKLKGFMIAGNHKGGRNALYVFDSNSKTLKSIEGFEELGQPFSFPMRSDFFYTYYSCGCADRCWKSFLCKFQDFEVKRLYSMGCDNCTDFELEDLTSGIAIENSGCELFEGLEKFDQIRMKWNNLLEKSPYP